MASTTTAKPTTSNVVQSNNGSRHKVGDMFLDDEQYDVCCSILRDDQPNVLITGVPGAGKTSLIKNLRKYLIQKQIECNLLSVEDGKYDLAEDAARELYPIAAMTGMARSLIGDDCTTLHAFLGVSSPDSLEDLLNKNKHWLSKMQPPQLARLRNAQKLFVEECFMLTLGFFAVMDHVLRVVRKNPHKPFGGLQLIMFGDAFQLGPVYTENSPEYKKYGGDICAIPLFTQTDLYYSANFEEFHLTKSYRQVADVKFARMLDRVRDASMTHEDVNALTSRNMETFTFIREYYKSHKLKWVDGGPNIEPTKLFTSNAGAKSENISRLLKLQGDVVNFTGYFLLTGLDYKTLRTATSGSVYNIKSLKTFVASYNVKPAECVRFGEVRQQDLDAHGFSKDVFKDPACPPSVDVVYDSELKLSVNDQRNLATNLLKTRVRTGVSLPLKIGAQVILTQNLSPELDLVNGSRGVVVAFKEDPMASMLNVAHVMGRMREGDMEDEEFEAEVFDLLAGEKAARTKQLWPEVKFTNGRVQLITPTLIDFGATLPEKLPRERRSGEPLTTYLVALPLLLAYSFTIHSFQGQTLSFGIVVCNGRMAPGQAYTAYSRFCNFTDFAQIGFTPRSVVAHPKAIEFEKSVLAKKRKRDEELSKEEYMDVESSSAPRKMVHAKTMV